jgi:hypothetical protein
MKGGIKAASNLIVVFYFNRQDIQKIGTSTKVLYNDQAACRNGIPPKSKHVEFLN